MRNTASILLWLSALLMGATAFAQDEDPWEGKVSLGYLSTSGNSESQSINAAAEVNYTTGRWHHIATASAVGAQQEEQTTAEAYTAGWKSEYDLSDVSYVFGRVRWQKDKFSGYDQQTTETLGYGRRLLRTDTQELNAELGVGLRQSDLRDGTSENETILRGALDYDWKFSETANFTQDLSLESGADNTFVESISAIKASLIGSMSLALTYTVRHNTDVPAGSEKTDTFTAISLEYGF